MFINAKPRPDLNGFRTFVPPRIVELSYQRPNSMMNNGSSAWRNLTPATSSAAAPGSWAYRFEETSDVENYSNPYSENFEEIPSYNQAPVGSNFRLGVPTRIEYPQQQPTTLMQLGTQLPYHWQELQSEMPLLRANVRANTSSNEWMMGHCTTDPARFPRAQFSSNAFSCVGQPSLEVASVISIPSSAGGPSLFSMYDTSSASDSFGCNKVEPGTVYTKPLGREGVPSSPKTVYLTPSAIQGSFNDGKLLQEMGQNSDCLDACGTTLPLTYDGLQNVSSVLWSAQCGTTSSWSQQIAPPGTISPQALSLIASSFSSIPGNCSPVSSSGMLSETSVTSHPFQESFGDKPHPTIHSARSKDIKFQNVDGDVLHIMAPPVRPEEIQVQSSGNNIAHSTFRPGASQTIDIEDPFDGVQHPIGRVLRPRQKLPSARIGQVCVPALPNNTCAVSRTEKKGNVLARPRVHGGRTNNPQSTLSIARQFPRKISSMQRPLLSHKTEPKVTENQVSGSIMVSSDCTPSSFETKETTQERIAKDKFLIESRQNGMSYKEISLKGGFTEAESTLRGRHRTLIKKPEERVRKPEWEGKDLSLLKKAVHKLAEDPSLPRPKVSWRRVSDYIFENGGSYRFGNSTCRRKWSQLYAGSSDQDFS